MRKLSFAGQHEYSHGKTMCSVASALMCLYVLTMDREVASFTEGNLDFVMMHSNQLYQKTFGSRASLFHVPFVLFAIGFTKRFKNIKVTEVAGCVEGTPEDMCGTECMDLAKFVSEIKHGECCTVTVSGHTTALGRQDGHVWFFDSLPGVLEVVQDHRDVVHKLLGGLHRGEQYSAVLLKFNE